MKNRQNKFPIHGWMGIILVVAFWYLNWNLDGFRTHLAFFPLWLGYILTVDGLVFLRKGSSLLTRSSKGFILLFVFSVPFWWLFELFNEVLQNWNYEGRDNFTDLEYALYASLSFSTVLPAILESAEFVAAYRPGNFRFPRWKTGRLVPPVFFISGWIMLFLFLMWPRIFFPLVWIAPYFIIEPVNHWLSFKTLLQFTNKGNWRPVWNLWLGALICGFFWEMWNINSFPKWTYDLPYLNAPKIFEMPFAGYLGYLPFSLELFALYHFLSGVLRVKSDKNFIRIE